MLFNARDFCGMANHISMLRLGEIRKARKLEVQTTFLADLSKEREVRNKGDMRRSLSFSQWGEHACYCVKQKAAVYAWCPSELQAIRVIAGQPWLEPGEQNVLLQGNNCGAGVWALGSCPFQAEQRQLTHFTGRPSDGNNFQSQLAANGWKAVTWR